MDSIKVKLGANNYDILYNIYFYADCSYYTITNTIIDF